MNRLNFVAETVVAYLMNLCVMAMMIVKMDRMNQIAKNQYNLIPINVWNEIPIKRILFAIQILNVYHCFYVASKFFLALFKDMI